MAVVPGGTIKSRCSKPPSIRQLLIIGPYGDLYLVRANVRSPTTAGLIGNRRKPGEPSRRTLPSPPWFPRRDHWSRFTASLIPRRLPADSSVELPRMPSEEHPTDRWWEGLLSTPSRDSRFDPDEPDRLGSNEAQRMVLF